MPTELEDSDRYSQPSKSEADEEALEEKAEKAGVGAVSAAAAAGLGVEEEPPEDDDDAETDGSGRKSATEYVILVEIPIENIDADDGVEWMYVPLAERYAATSARQAKTKAAEDGAFASMIEGGIRNVSAVPERSWNPEKMNIQTKIIVTFE